MYGDYKSTTGLNSAWKSAQESISVQHTHQVMYDKTLHSYPLQVVIVYLPNDAQGKTWELARPFHCLYCILSLTPTNPGGIST